MAKDGGNIYQTARNAHVTLRSSNKNDKDRRSTLFRTAQG